VGREEDRMSSEAPTNRVTPRAADVIDIEALLAPIPGENPAGENLQYSGLHDELREARRADEDLEQGDWKRELKTADWRLVISLSTEALTSRTKDLHIAAWLSEALVKLHGLVGLRDCLSLLLGLHERFWDNLYPESDEGDLEARANALAFLDRQVAIAIREVPISSTTTGSNLSYRQYEETRQSQTPQDLGSETDQSESGETIRSSVADEHARTAEDWTRAKSGTGRAYFEELLLLLDECWSRHQSLDRTMDERFGRQTPGLGDLKKILEAMRTLIGNVVKEKRVSEPYPDEVRGVAGEPDGNGSVRGHDASPNGSIRARVDAFRRLAEVADYFRINEPHSPVAYLVQRAIKWGQMPLDSWLEDVIKDGSVLGQLRDTLGLTAALSGAMDE
jgi:type VI secretion system protein ImpA